MLLIQRCYVILHFTALFVFCQPSDCFRDFFEWGDYQSLVDTLTPLLTSDTAGVADSVTANYHVYLGVAFFTKGDMLNSRKQFVRALSFDSTITPDERFISEPIRNYYSTIRIAYSEEQKKLRQRDSLLYVTQSGFEQNIRLLADTKYQATRRSTIIMSGFLLIGGAAIAGFTAKEYYATKPVYRRFKTAAAEGDKSEYNALLPSLRTANALILAAGGTAVLSTGIGITFAIKSVKPRLDSRSGNENPR